MKEISWREIRDAMCYDKKEIPVYKAEYLKKYAKYGAFQECEAYVEKLQNAIHELLLIKDYKIIELENEIKKFRR